MELRNSIAFVSCLVLPLRSSANLAQMLTPGVVAFIVKYATILSGILLSRSFECER